MVVVFSFVWEGKDVIVIGVVVELLQMGDEVMCFFFYIEFSNVGDVVLLCVCLFWYGMWNWGNVVEEGVKFD